MDIDLGVLWGMVCNCNFNDGEQHNDFLVIYQKNVVYNLQVALVLAYKCRNDFPMIECCIYKGAPFTLLEFYRTFQSIVLKQIIVTKFKIVCKDSCLS